VKRGEKITASRVRNSIFSFVPFIFR